MPPTRRRFRLALCLGAALFLAAPAAVPGAAAAESAGAFLAARSAARANDFAAAARYHAEALVADPGNQDLMEGLLISHVGAGDLSRAIPVARRMLQAGNVSQPVLLMLLADQLQRRAFDEALADLAAGRAVGPLVDGLTRAWSELGAGRMAQALDAFDRLIATPGLQPFGDYHKALALASVGDFEGADAIFAAQEGGIRMTRRGAIAHAQILSQIDRGAEALENLALLFGNGSDPELDALRASLAAGAPVPFDIVRDAADGLAESFYTLAAALQGEAADTQTLIYSRIAQHLRPDHADAILTSAALLESLEQRELAIAAYDLIPEGSPARLAAQTGRAGALFGLERQDEAIAAMQTLAAAYPSYMSVHVGLGDMLRRQERYDEASAAYSTAIDLAGDPEPRHWALYYSRGITYERAKDWDRAEPDFRKALELNPDQPSVLNYLGYSFLELNRNLAEAMDMIERAVAQRPDDGYIVDSLAWGYFMLGRYDEAVAPMERAALLMPVDPIVTDHLGDVYWAVGRVLEARFQWRRALSFGPEEKDAVRIRRKLEIGLDAVLEEEGARPLSARGQ